MSRIVLLHGASSSGKTTLASALIASAPFPVLRLSFDTYRDGGALPPDKAGWTLMRDAMFDGMHRSFAAFADSGCDLIIEHILDSPGWHEQLQGLLAPHDLLFVGVMTPVEALNAREKARGDRRIGSAAEDAVRIHDGLSYDIMVDGGAPAETNAETLLTALTVADRPRSAFFSS